MAQISTEGMAQIEIVIKNENGIVLGSSFGVFHPSLLELKEGVFAIGHTISAMGENLAAEVVNTKK